MSDSSHNQNSFTGDQSIPFQVPRFRTATSYSSDVNKALAIQNSIDQYSQYLSERRIRLNNILIPFASSWSIGTATLATYVYIANTFSASSITNPFYPVFERMSKLITKYHGTHKYTRLRALSGFVGFNLLPLSLLWTYIVYEYSHLYGNAPARISIEARKILNHEGKVFLRDYGFDEYLDNGISDYSRNFNDVWCRDDRC